VVAEAEHLRVLDAVQAGVDEKPWDSPRVSSSTIGRGRESFGRIASHRHGCSLRWRVAQRWNSTPRWERTRYLTAKIASR
jgi:hypothetical protein